MAVLPGSPGESLVHRGRRLLLLDGALSLRLRWWYGLRRHRGVAVGSDVLAASVGADFVDNESDDETEDEKRRPEDPDWLSDTVAGNADGVGRAHSAEHDDGIAADRDVLAQVGAAEEV